MLLNEFSVAHESCLLCNRRVSNLVKVTTVSLSLVCFVFFIFPPLCFGE